VYVPTVETIELRKDDAIKVTDSVEDIRLDTLKINITNEQTIHFTDYPLFPFNDVVLALKVSPEQTVFTGGSVTLIATLKDSNNQPIQGARIQFAVNSQWNYSHYSITDEDGEATYVQSLSNDVNTYGFVGSSTIKSTMYTANAMYAGNRTDAKFMVSSSGTKTQMKIYIQTPNNLSTITPGNPLNVTGYLLKLDGTSPGRGFTVVVSGCHDTQERPTDHKGMFTTAVPLITGQAINGANTITAMFKGTSELFGCAANIQVVAGGVEEIYPTKPYPVPYVMQDDLKPEYTIHPASLSPYYQNNDPELLKKTLTAPSTWGEFGSFFNNVWRSMDVDDFANMKAWVAYSRGLGKRVIIGIYFYAATDLPPLQPFTDYTPDSVKSAIGGSYVVKPTDINGVEITNPSIAVSGYAPRYNNSDWQNAFIAMVRRFGVAFNNDPNVDGVAICSGLDGECNPIKDWEGKGVYYSRSFNALCPSGYFYKQFIEGIVIPTYVSAFPDKALYLQSFPQTERGISFGMTQTSSPVRLRTENWYSDAGGWAYQTVSETSATSEAYQNRPFTPKSCESIYGQHLMGGDGGTYAMLLCMLGHGIIDWVDLHSDHFDLFGHTQNQPYLGVSDFATWFREHLGVNTKTTPSVWCSLRDIQSEGTKENNGNNMSEVYGNYAMGLYQLESFSGYKTKKIYKSNLPSLAQTSWMTNPDNQCRLNLRTSPAVVAKSTDKLNGSNSILFDVDSGFAEGSGNYSISIIYLDEGFDTFALEWFNEYGSLQQEIITRANSHNWKTATKTVTNLNDGFVISGIGIGDFRINCLGNTDVVVHLVDVRKI